MTTITARQTKGIPVGGQFAATTHADPEVRLVLAHLREYARPLPYPPGSRVMVDGEFGTISGNPDPYTGALPGASRQPSEAAQRLGLIQPRRPDLLPRHCVG
jgi:hypothetical protein